MTRLKVMLSMKKSLLAGIVEMTLTIAGNPETQMINVTQETDQSLVVVIVRVLIPVQCGTVKESQ